MNIRKREKQMKTEKIKYQTPDLKILKLLNQTLIKSYQHTTEKNCLSTYVCLKVVYTISV